MNGSIDWMDKAMQFQDRASKAESVVKEQAAVIERVRKAIVHATRTPMRSWDAGECICAQSVRDILDLLPVADGANNDSVQPGAPDELSICDVCGEPALRAALSPAPTQCHCGSTGHPHDVACPSYEAPAQAQAAKLAPSEEWQRGYETGTAKMTGAVQMANRCAQRRGQRAMKAEARVDEQAAVIERVRAVFEYLDNETEQHLKKPAVMRAYSDAAIRLEAALSPAPAQCHCGPTGHPHDVACPSYEAPAQVCDHEGFCICDQQSRTDPAQEPRRVYGGEGMPDVELDDAPAQAAEPEALSADPAETKRETAERWRGRALSAEARVAELGSSLRALRERTEEEANHLSELLTESRGETRALQTWVDQAVKCLTQKPVPWVERALEILRGK